MRNYARDSHAGNVETDDDYEEKIENYVDYSGYNEVYERTTGISDRRVNSVAAVIRRKRGHSEKVNPKIQRRAVQKFLFRAENPKKRAGESDADRKQNNADDKAYKKRGMSGFSHPVVVFRSVIARDYRVYAAAHAQKHAREHRHDRCRRADRSERTVPTEPADYRHVRHIEKHLQNVAKNKRQAENKYLFKKRTLRKIFLSALFLVRGSGITAVAA